MKTLLSLFVTFVLATITANFAAGAEVDNKSARDIKTVPLLDLLKNLASKPDFATKTKPTKQVAVGEIIKLSFQGRESVPPLNGESAVVKLGDVLAERFTANSTMLYLYYIVAKVPSEGYPWFAKIPHNSDDRYKLPNGQRTDRMRAFPVKYVYCRVLSLSGTGDEPSVELLGHETKSDTKMTRFVW